MIASEQLRLYRSNHRIQEQGGRCAVDGIRVWPVKGGRMRHDPGDIVKLIKAEYGGPWTSVRDEAERLVAQDIAREDIFEEGRITVEWHGHAVDVDLAPDPAPHGMSEEYQRRYERTGADPYAMFSGDEPEDDWTNREGQPEFNGSFR